MQTHADVFCCDSIAPNMDKSHDIDRASATATDVSTDGVHLSGAAADTFTANRRITPKRLLLHACCGPCSLEPVRTLQERGITLAIHYSNSNIAPYAEYIKRLETIRTFVEEAGIEFIEDVYDNDEWLAGAGSIGAAEAGSEKRKARCRACYRMRLERSACYARDHGFDALGTTLSVSPYQYGAVIEEELVRAAEQVGIDAFFEDYSPLYQNATRRSRTAGMYRQNYCGCAFSDAEAAAERAERKAQRDEEKRLRAQEMAPALKRAEQLRAEKRQRQCEYDKKQARKRAVLKALREERRCADKEQ